MTKNKGLYNKRKSTRDKAKKISKEVLDRMNSKKKKSIVSKEEVSKIKPLKVEVKEFDEENNESENSSSDDRSFKKAWDMEKSKTHKLKEQIREILKTPSLTPIEKNNKIYDLITK